MSIGLKSLERKSLSEPDQVMMMPKGRIEIVEVAGKKIGRATFEPGWKWSEHEKPEVGTEQCEVPHIGYLVKGRIRVVMQDGSQVTLQPGDAFSLPPGHDGWVVGEETAVMVDFAGLAADGGTQG